MKFNKTPAKHRVISRLVLFLFFPPIALFSALYYIHTSYYTELGMKDLTNHYPLLDYFSYLTIYGDRGDLAEFGKKRNTDHGFPPPLYVGGK